MITATMAAKKIEAARQQIADLQARKFEMASRWLEVGYEKATEACEAISNQIIALYEEIDALEAGETAKTGDTSKSDEVSISPIEMAGLADLGWTVEDLIKSKQKAARRKMAGR